MDRKYLEPKEAAARLNLSPITLAIWRCQRPLKLRYYKQRNGRIKYDVDDVDRLATERRTLDLHDKSEDS